MIEDPNKPALNTFTITYNTGEEGSKVGQEIVVAGSQAQRPTDPTRTGYDFVQWEDKENPGTAFDFEQQIFKSYELDAVWAEQEYTVSYDIKGAEGIVPGSVTVKYGDPIPLPSGEGLTKTGAAFKGWARDGMPVTVEDTVYGDTVLTAIWEWNTLTITYHPQNSEGDIIKYVRYGRAVPEFTAPTRTDYLFTGWFYANDDEYHFSDIMTADTELFAHWVREYYHITFVPNGCNEEFEQVVKFQEKVQKPTDPTWKC